MTPGTPIEQPSTTDLGAGLVRLPAEVGTEQGEQPQTSSAWPVYDCDRPVPPRTTPARRHPGVSKVLRVVLLLGGMSLNMAALLGVFVAPMFDPIPWSDDRVWECPDTATRDNPDTNATTYTLSYHSDISVGNGVNPRWYDVDLDWSSACGAADFTQAASTVEATMWQQTSPSWERDASRVLWVAWEPKIQQAGEGLDFAGWRVEDQWNPEEHQWESVRIGFDVSAMFTFENRGMSTVGVATPAMVDYLNDHEGEVDFEFTVSGVNTPDHNDAERNNAAAVQSVGGWLESMEETLLLWALAPLLLCILGVVLPSRSAATIGAPAERTSPMVVMSYAKAIRTLAKTVDAGPSPKLCAWIARIGVWPEVAAQVACLRGTWSVNRVVLDAAIAYLSDVRHRVLRPKGVVMRPRSRPVAGVPHGVGQR